MSAAQWLLWPLNYSNPKSISTYKQRLNIKKQKRKDLRVLGDSQSLPVCFCLCFLGFCLWWVKQQFISHVYFEWQNLAAEHLAEKPCKPQNFIFQVAEQDSNKNCISLGLFLILYKFKLCTTVAIDTRRTKIREWMWCVRPNFEWIIW